MRLLTLAFAASTVVTGVATVLVGITHRCWFAVDPLGATLAWCGAFIGWVTCTLILTTLTGRNHGL